MSLQKYQLGSSIENSQKEAGRGTENHSVDYCKCPHKKYKPIK